MFDFGVATPLHSLASLALPDLGSAGVWDTHQLFTSGRLTIAAVPEPRPAALLLAGPLALALLRRRRPGVPA